MIDKLINIKNKFIENSELVKELMNFDRLILDYCIIHIENLNERLKNLKITNPYLLADNTLKGLKAVRENDSMRPKYESIFNQCLVLLVSHYTTTMEEFFKTCIDLLILSNKDIFTFNDDSIKITLNELKQVNFDLSENFGEILMKKKDISFQDMQSSNRAFKQYLGFSIPIDKKLNNIIIAQAMRHIIVHSSSIVDDKFISQIRNLDLRDVKTNIKKNDLIKISYEEINIIDESMRNIIDFCIQQIKVRLK